MVVSARRALATSSAVAAAALVASDSPAATSSTAGGQVLPASSPSNHDRVSRRSSSCNSAAPSAGVDLFASAARSASPTAAGSCLGDEMSLKVGVVYPILL